MLRAKCKVNSNARLWFSLSVNKASVQLWHPASNRPAAQLLRRQIWLVFLRHRTLVADANRDGTLHRFVFHFCCTFGGTFEESHSGITLNGGKKNGDIELNPIIGPKHGGEPCASSVILLEIRLIAL